MTAHDVKVNYGVDADYRANYRRHATTLLLA
jgi:hypothetical protein